MQAAGAKQELGFEHGKVVSMGQSILWLLSGVPGNRWSESWTDNLHAQSF